MSRDTTRDVGGLSSGSHPEEEHGNGNGRGISPESTQSSSSQVALLMKLWNEEKEKRNEADRELAKLRVTLAQERATNANLLSMLTNITQFPSDLLKPASAASGSGRVADTISLPFSHPAQQPLTIQQHQPTPLTNHEMSPQGLQYSLGAPGQSPLLPQSPAQYQVVESLYQHPPPPQIHHHQPFHVHQSVQHSMIPHETSPPSHHQKQAFSIHSPVTGVMGNYNSMSALPGSVGGISPPISGNSNVHAGQIYGHLPTNISSAVSAAPAQVVTTSSMAKAETGKTENYKTKLCRNYAQHGACNYEATCQFAHGGHELRPEVTASGIPVHDPVKYKTSLCLNYMNHGFCSYQSVCQFAHGPHELRK